MKTNLQAWFISLCFGSFLALTSCQHHINNMNFTDSEVEQDVNNLRRGAGSQIIAFGVQFLDLFSRQAIGVTRTLSTRLLSIFITSNRKLFQSK